MNIVDADYSDPAASFPTVVSDLSIQTLANVSEKIGEFGFAVLQMPPDLNPNDAISGLADGLALGEAFVPNVYRNSNIDGHTKQFFQIRTDATSEHPAFGVTAGQAWHVDGTLEDIGKIRTTNSGMSFYGFYRPTG